MKTIVILKKKTPSLQNNVENTMTSVIYFGRSHTHKERAETSIFIEEFERSSERKVMAETELQCIWRRHKFKMCRFLKLLFEPCVVFKLAVLPEPNF